MYEVLAADSGSEKEQRFIGFDVEAAGASINGLEPPSTYRYSSKGLLIKVLVCFVPKPFFFPFWMVIRFRTFKGTL